MIWSAQSAISVSFYSSIAQSVEHAAVNRAVVGSSPTRGVYNYKNIVIGTIGCPLI